MISGMSVLKVYDMNNYCHVFLTDVPRKELSKAIFLCTSYDDFKYWAKSNNFHVEKLKTDVSVHTIWEVTNE